MSARARQSFLACCLVFVLSGCCDIRLFDTSEMREWPGHRGAGIDETTLVGTPGFFRVGQATNGRWWLVDDAGRPFFYKGVVAVNRSGLMGGRHAAPGPYTVVVDRKYGTDPQRFVQAQLARIREWNFNALGAWTTEDFFDQGMPYTEILMLNYLGAPEATRHWARRPQGSASLILDYLGTPEVPVGLNLPDVHNPGWISAVDEECARICVPRRSSRQLIGYFTDNELTWYHPPEAIVPEAGLVGGFLPNQRAWLLQHCLMLDADRPAAKAAWDFILKRHGDLAGLSKAWGVAIADRADLRTWTMRTRSVIRDPKTGENRRDEKTGAVATVEHAVPKALATPGYLKDCRDWVQDWARRYFAITAAAVRKHDPNHLVLGCRFGGFPGRAVLAECKRPNLDVLSFNTYWTRTAQVAEHYFRPTGMPLLVSEYAWVSNHYIRNPPAAPKPVDLSQVDKIRQNGPPALEALIGHPGVIGYSWYRWVDWPDNRPPFGWGLVMLDDEPNRVHTDLLTVINAKAERIAEAADPKAPRELIEEKPFGAPAQPRPPGKPAKDAK